MKSNDRLIDFVKGVIRDKHPHIKNLEVSMEGEVLNIIYQDDSADLNIDDLLISFSAILVFANVVPIRNIRYVVK